MFVLQGFVVLLCAGATMSQSIATSNGNLIARVPAGKSFSVSCPGDNQSAVVECSGPYVQIVNGQCVPVASFATAQALDQVSNSTNSRFERVGNTTDNLSARMDNLVQNLTSGGDATANVVVVGMSTSENCTFGNCDIIVAAKSISGNVALVKNAPIYSCQFSAGALVTPAMSDPVQSLDGYTVMCSMPNHPFPLGSGSPNLQLSVTLFEGSNALPWGHGSTGAVSVTAGSFLANPTAPFIGLESEVTIYNNTLPPSNMYLIQFNVFDPDTPPSNVTVTLSSPTLTATVQQDGNSDSYRLTISNVYTGNLHYMANITVTATDGLHTTTATISVTFIGDPAVSAPAGTNVATQSQFQNIMYDLRVPNYRSNINNLRATSMIMSVVTKRANSKIFVHSQFTMACHTGSHCYVDIWRQIGGGRYQSLGRLYGGSRADGLVSEHPPGSTGGYYEQQKTPFVLDTPNQPANTRITYRIYVGAWSGGTITMGSHRNGNQNGNSPEFFMAEEIAGSNCVDPSGRVIPCAAADRLPVGSPVSAQSTWSNHQYDVYCPSYRNNINSFRPTSIGITVETAYNNSKVLVMSQFVAASHSGSHVYVDIWRKIGSSGTFTSLARLIAGPTADGLISEHPQGSTSGWYEQSKTPFVLDEPNQPAGTTIEYKVYVGLWSGSHITIGGHRSSNFNGQSPSHMVAREILGEGPSEEGSVALAVPSLPSGAIINTVSRMMTQVEDIYCYSYGNNINNLRETSMSIGVTTLQANSKIFVRTQFTMAAHTGSHVYVDIWRSVNNGPFTSLARALGNSGADGIMSEHTPGGTNSWYEQSKNPFLVDTPGQPAGTLITYKVYVGLWSQGTITMGGHRLNNGNGESPSLMIAQEVLN